MIADEVQTGLGRTGAMLAVDHEQANPNHNPNPKPNPNPNPNSKPNPNLVRPDVP